MSFTLHEKLNCMKKEKRGAYSLYGGLSLICEIVRALYLQICPLPSPVVDDKLGKMQM